MIGQNMKLKLKKKKTLKINQHYIAHELRSF